MKRRTRTLAARILFAVLAILLVTVAVGTYLVVTFNARALDHQYEQRAVSIAETVAQIPEVAPALRRNDPGRTLQVLAERIRTASGAAYVVIANRSGIRFSHPNQALIGKRLEEPVAVLDGRDHVGIDHGSLGRSANGKTPILDASGSIVGQVSVGILETQVSSEQAREAWGIGLYAVLVLTLGAGASWLLARAIKRVTFGIEPHDFAALLQEREAMLYGIREGVLCLDTQGKVTVLNAEAERLLGLGPTAVGRMTEDLVPPGRLRDVLCGQITGNDVEVLTVDYLLVVNRRSVAVGAREVGAVVTLRDRTESEALLRELRAVNGLTSAMRAQEHEYANRLHVISGLLELGELAEAHDYLAEISNGAIARADDLRARISPAAVAALITAKIALAAEQSVTIVLTPESRLDRAREDTATLLTVIGNLLDNATEAVAGRPEPRQVTLSITDSEEGVLISVEDSGPGIAAADPNIVFQDGWSTKEQRNGQRRGVGLALVQRIVRHAGGTINVIGGSATRFEAWLPDMDFADAPGGRQ